jgi:hypothetical protein
MKDNFEFTEGFAVLEEINPINKASKLGEMISLRIRNQTLENDNQEKYDDEIEL